MYSSNEFPSWMLFHVPHDSTLIPLAVRDHFLLTEDELLNELRLMTDHHTRDLFTRGLADHQVIASNVSRLVVDVERFDLDEEEPMSSKGMGVIYERTHDGHRLRKPPTDSERQHLLEKWYYPHHERLEQSVAECLSRWGKALIIDCHSYASCCLPYEKNQSSHRPEICIGTDPFHSPKKLVGDLTLALSNEGFEVGLNSPFSGSLVPMACYRKDRRVMSAMIEVRRDLYLDEEHGRLATSYEETYLKIRRALRSIFLG